MRPGRRAADVGHHRGAALCRRWRRKRGRSRPDPEPGEGNDSPPRHRERLLIGPDGCRERDAERSAGAGRRRVRRCPAPPTAVFEDDGDTVQRVPAAPRRSRRGMADERGCGGLLNLRAAWRRGHRPMRGLATESADLCFTWNSRPICRRVRHPTDSAVAAHRIGLAMTGLHAAADDLRSSGAADPADADGAEPPPNARPTPHVRRYAETGAPAVCESRRVVPPRPVVAADPCALLARVDAYTGGLDSLVRGTGCLRSRPATVSATGRAEATRRPRTNQPPQIGERPVTARRPNRSRASKATWF